MGQYKGHLWSEAAADLTVEMAQFKRCHEEEFRRMMACEMVKGKLANSRVFLQRLNRGRHLPEVVRAIDQLEEYRTKLGPALTVDQVRGYEGTGAACYFAALGRLIDHPDFVFTTRTYHPPLDAVNALLSFGYTLLV